ncbi:outer membrane protein assembly factor BamB family protein [Streptomyces sp. NBC_01235]|uniref:outer membrane protein assembly factor BamB family protein n=1 Tax=Streptomyces sp. NBC_01235 TaxID=2903788 RepID=UPI002E0FC00F|nr:PQQ-like beta-propeller repeat protein [Streptomyces sp. NBC_01235]
MATPRHFLPACAAGTVMSLGLLTGCGGGDGPADPEATGQARPRASASTAPQARYPGEPIPGLATKPAWSLAPRSDAVRRCGGDAALPAEKQNETGRCAVGDAFLLVEDLSAPVAVGETQPQTTRFLAHLYDAATGKERRSFTVTCTYDPSGGDAPQPATRVQVGTWRDGSPAVLIRDCENTEAGGPDKAAATTVYTMYAPSGTKLGSSAYAGEDHAGLPVVRGHVLLPGDAHEARTLAPIGGGQNLVLPAGAEPLDTGRGYATRGTGVNEPLSVIDQGTGRTLWTTTDLTPPDGVAEQNQNGEEPDAGLYPLHGDRAILVWSASGSDDAVLTTVDLRTGATLAVGPRTRLKQFTQDAGPVVSPDGETAVVNFAEGAVAWDTRTGAELWRQDADGKDVRPRTVTPGGVLYAELDQEDAALAMRTGKPLGPLPQDVDVPLEFTGNGYTLVTAGEALFAFAATKT